MALQWGRDLIVAETVPRNAFSVRRRTASMGPRLDSRGNKIRSEVESVVNELQWGRDLIVAET